MLKYFDVPPAMPTKCWLRRNNNWTMNQLSISTDKAVISTLPLSEFHYIIILHFQYNKNHCLGWKRSLSCSTFNTSLSIPTECWLRQNFHLTINQLSLSGNSSVSFPAVSANKTQIEYQLLARITMRKLKFDWVDELPV